MKRITKEEFAERMAEIAKMGDPEAQHGKADALMTKTLRSLGYEVGADVFDSMKKWYS